jgi:hypothetical protein
MSYSNMRAGKFSSTVGRIVMALVFTLIVGGMSIAPAFGDNHGRGGKGHRGHGYGGRGYYQPGPGYYYPAPVYAPPPVVYVPSPYQSPGISLVFPIVIR